MKYVFEDLLQPHSPVIENATIVKNGRLTERFAYLQGYVRD
jgi:ribosomal protein L19